MTIWPFSSNSLPSRAKCQNSETGWDKLGQTETERPRKAKVFLLRESPDLALVVEAWPDLPEAIRAGIPAMVRAAATEETADDAQSTRSTL